MPGSPSSVDRRQLADDVHRRVLVDDRFATLAAELLALRSWAEEPTTAPPRVSVAALRHLNAIQRAEQDEEAAARALTTAEVIAHVDGVRTRAAVASRVDRGRLLTFKAANGHTNLYPAWQLDPRRPATVPVVERLVVACRDLFAGDVIAFDLMVRSPQERLGGLSVADLLADGRFDEAARAAERAPEQDG